MTTHDGGSSRDRRYRLASGTEAMPVDDGSLLLRSEFAAVPLAPDAAAFFTGQLLPALRQGLDLDHPPALSPPVPTGRLVPYLEELVAVGVLERVTHDDGGIAPPLSALLRTTGRASAMARLRSLRVAVVGLEGPGAHLAVLLAQAGVGTVVVVDPYPCRAGNLPLMPPVPADAIGVPRQVVVAALLSAAAPETTVVRGPDGALTEADVEALVAGCDGVAGSFDRAFGDCHHWLNRAARSAGIPAVFAALHAGALVVGPTASSRPGTACYNCWRLRAMAATDPGLRPAAYEEFSRGGPPSLHARPMFPSLSAVAAGVLAAELMAVLLHGESTLTNQVQVLEAPPPRTGVHVVLPRPDCPVCSSGRGRRTRAASAGVDEDDRTAPGDIVAAAPQLVSPVSGIVTELWHTATATTPRVNIARATFANHRLSPVERPRPTVGWGRGMTQDESAAGALGEAVESYCGSMWVDGDIVRAPYAEVRDRALDPRYLVLYAPEQYSDVPYAPFDPSAPLGWVEGRSLDSGRPTLLPALACLAGYQPVEPAERLFPFQIGRAAGPGLSAAVLAAALEVVEREAFMTMWLNRLPCVRSDIDSHPDAEIVRLVRDFGRRGTDIEVLRLPTDQPVAVMMALALTTNGPPREPAVAVGLGAGFEPARAARHAVLEAVMVRWGMRQWMEQADARDRAAWLAADPRRVADRMDHKLLWTHPGAVAALAFLEESVPDATGWQAGEVPTAAGDQLRHLARHLSRQDNDLVYHDLTTDDVGRLGLHVARVFIPGFQPMHFGYGEPRLGGDRVFDLPRLLGLRPERTAIDDVNRYPHPCG